MESTGFNKRQQLNFRISIVLRIIIIAIVLAPLNLTIWNFLQDPEGFGSPVTTFTLLSVGPSFITSGIVLSLFNKKCPAILRIETALGLFLLFAVGIISIFSVGMYFLAAGLFALVLLMNDYFLWNEYSDVEMPKGFENNSRLRFIALLVPVFITFAIILFFPIIGFIAPMIIVVIPLGILLFKAFEANSTSKWYTLLIPFLIVLLFAGSFFYQKNSEAQITATLSKDESGSSSEGELSNEGGGLLQSDDLSLNYEVLNKHTDSVKFKLNGVIYYIAKNARTLIYGQIYKNDVSYVCLEFRDKPKKTVTVKNNLFATWLPQPHSEKNISKVLLLNRNKKIISTNKVE